MKIKSTPLIWAILVMSSCSITKAPQRTSISDKFASTCKFNFNPESINIEKHDFLNGIVSINRTTEPFGIHQFNSQFTEIPIPINQDSCDQIISNSEESTFVVITSAQTTSHADSLIFNEVSKVESKHNLFKNKPEREYKTEPFAVIALIAGLVLFWPLLDGELGLLLLLAVIALVFGILGMLKIKNKYPERKGIWMARIGVIIGGSVFAAMLIFLLYILIATAIG